MRSLNINKQADTGKDGKKKKKKDATPTLQAVKVLNNRASVEITKRNQTIMDKFGVPEGGQTRYKNKVWEAVVVGKDSTTISRPDSKQSYKISNLQLAKQNKYGSTYQLTGTKETKAEKIARLTGK